MCQIHFPIFNAKHTQHSVSDFLLVLLFFLRLFLRFVSDNRSYEISYFPLLFLCCCCCCCSFSPQLTRSIVQNWYVSVDICEKAIAKSDLKMYRICWLFVDYAFSSFRWTKSAFRQYFILFIRLSSFFWQNFNCRWLFFCYLLLPVECYFVCCDGWKSNECSDYCWCCCTKDFHALKCLAPKTEETQSKNVVFYWCRWL